MSKQCVEVFDFYTVNGKNMVVFTWILMNYKLVWIHLTMTFLKNGRSSSNVYCIHNTQYTIQINWGVTHINAPPQHKQWLCIRQGTVDIVDMYPVKGSTYLSPAIWWRGDGFFSALVWSNLSSRYPWSIFYSWFLFYSITPLLSSFPLHIIFALTKYFSISRASKMCCFYLSMSLWVHKSLKLLSLR